MSATYLPPLEEEDSDSDIDIDSILNADPSKKKGWSSKQHLIRHIQGRLGTLSSGKPPLNIAVIGPPGCGKSSLLNTIFASFSNIEWRELAESGNHGGRGCRISYQLKSFPKEKYYNRQTESLEDDDILMPTFIDLMGFENSYEPWAQELLKIVFYGRMKEGESFWDVLNDVKRFCTNSDIAGLTEKYRKRDNHRKIDRIMVVCSGDPNEELPQELLMCIMKEAKGKRNIPIYGVMTKADKFNGNNNPKVRKREDNFRELLGIPLNRFQRIANYCENVDPKRNYIYSVIPMLDVKVLHLMNQILDLEVTNSDYDYPGETKEEQDARPIHANEQVHVVRDKPGPQPPPVNGLNRTWLFIIIAVQVILIAVMVIYAFIYASRHR